MEAILPRLMMNPRHPKGTGVDFTYKTTEVPARGFRMFISGMAGIILKWAPHRPHRLSTPIFSIISGLTMPSYQEFLWRRVPQNLNLWRLQTAGTTAFG